VKSFRISNVFGGDEGVTCRSLHGFKENITRGGGNVIATDYELETHSEPGEAKEKLKGGYYHEKKSE
jgi:hypothetical protein